MTRSLLSGVEIARQNLRQIEQFQPTEEWQRIVKAQNLEQVRYWLARHGEVDIIIDPPFRT